MFTSWKLTKLLLINSFKKPPYEFKREFYFNVGEYSERVSLFTKVILVMMFFLYVCILYVNLNYVYNRLRVMQTHKNPFNKLLHGNTGYIEERGLFKCRVSYSVSATLLKVFRSWCLFSILHVNLNYVCNRLRIRKVLWINSFFPSSLIFQYSPCLLEK